MDLTRKSARDLAWLVEQELNKTTLVNRAVQVLPPHHGSPELNGKQVVIEGFSDDNEVERSKWVLV